MNRVGMSFSRKRFDVSQKITNFVCQICLFTMNDICNDTSAAQFLAVDLGATSGRTVLGSVADGKLSLRELTRFPNRIIQTGGHFYWDIYALYAEILCALRQVADEGIAIRSIGIDTWGVDFVCIGRDGAILRNPVSYRDPHTEGIMEAFHKEFPRDLIYRKTGIQFLAFNSLYQFAAMRKAGDSALKAAAKVLFLPDALIYMLTGQTVCEYTILSTSQMMDAETKQLDAELLEAVGLKRHHFGRYVQPCDVVGRLSPEVQRLTGLADVPVVAVASHDTASAVAAVPAADEHFAFLSCGTWSLLGIETSQPVITEDSYASNFTNEGGIEGTTRLLKNIGGLWMLERCRQEWTDAPADINAVNAGAMTAPEHLCLINPDSERFANPPSMVEAIKVFCRLTDQPVPETWQQQARCIFEGITLRYSSVLRELERLAPFPIERLHVIGGGTHNSYLMQMTADSIQLPVVTGPAEGTAIGNIMVQAKAAGIVADRFAMRRIIADSIETKIYLPHKR